MSEEKNTGPVDDNQPELTEDPPPQDSEAGAEEEELLEEEPGDDKVMAALAATMPWVISLLFHVGVFLLMLFLVFVVFEAGEEAEGIIIPDATLSENPGGVMTPSESTQKAVKKAVTAKSRRISKSPTVDTGKTNKAVAIAGVGGASAAGGAAAMGMAAASGGGPKATFFGTGGNAHNIVYVIDRSGSMIDTFDNVRMEMLHSIGRLKDSQLFHVILFATGDPIEMSEKRLVPATRRNRKEAAVFLEGINPEERTDPVPALNRAFSVLNQARKKGRLIYLLTDGVFPDNDKVLRTVRSKNVGKEKVYINTFLYGSKPPEAVDVMQRIAKDTGGRYKYVEHQR